MNLYEVLFAKKLNGGGGGGEAVLIDKSITANGTYNASSDNADGYKKVVVNVPNPSTGTIQITQNGTVNVTNYASAEVNVPNYEAEILSATLSGAYVNNEVTSLRKSAFEGYTSLTSVSLPECIGAGANAFYNATNIETLNLPKLAYTSNNYIFAGIKKMQVIALPSQYGNLGSWAFQNDEKLATIDIGSAVSTLSAQCFSGTILSTLIIRKTSQPAPLQNVNCFNGTPFASGGTGGILYVPNAMISSYQSASNWSTILGYANNQIKKIEGTIYETQYADGTAI